MTTTWTKVSTPTGTGYTNVSIARPGDATSIWDAGVTVWDELSNIIETFWDVATPPTVWTKVSP